MSIKNAVEMKCTLFGNEFECIVYVKKRIKHKIQIQS